MNCDVVMALTDLEAIGSEVLIEIPPLVDEGLPALFYRTPCVSSSVILHRSSVARPSDRLRALPVLDDRTAADGRALGVDVWDPQVNWLAANSQGCARVDLGDVTHHRCL